MPQPLLSPTRAACSSAAARLHAYPDGSDTALCGHRGAKRVVGGEHCVVCDLLLYGGRQWSGR